MEVDEVQSISSASASPPHKELNSPQSDLDEREIILEDFSQNIHSQQTPSSSQPADQEKIVLSDKDEYISSGDEEFISPPVSNSQLNEIEFEPQVEQSDNSQEQVINLTERLDSPITMPNTSQQDSSSNYSPPRASSSPSSSTDLTSPSKEPTTPPPTSRSRRSAEIDSDDFSRGQLVWAKVSGFRFWPGLIVDAKSAMSLPSKLRTPYREGWLLVHFFGTYDYAWVPPKSCIVSWYLGNKKGYMNKCKSKFFQLGLSEANHFQTDGTMPLGFSAIPQVLESGSESDSIVSVDSTEIKPINAKRKLSGNNVPVVSIKKMKLSEYQASNSSQDSNLTSEQSRNQRGRKRRCEIVMKRLGLAPPDKYLGRKLPKKVNIDPDFEL